MIPLDAELLENYSAKREPFAAEQTLTDLLHWKAVNQHCLKVFDLLIVTAGTILVARESPRAPGPFVKV
jgi:hypothetical protein